MLQNRKQQVTIVSEENNYVISLTNEQIDQGEEIERSIVCALIDRHQSFVQSTENKSN